MKTRNGFVSNSSSSSFIVVYKEEVDESKTGSPFNFGDIMEDWIQAHGHHSDYDMLAHGKQRMTSYMGSRDEDYGREDWEDVKQKLAEHLDGIPLMFHVSHHDIIFPVVLKVYEDAGYVTVLERESL
jgi:hypothetical protein